MTHSTVRRRYQIGGRVQMVGFRMFATVHAQRLGLRGWVRNLPSGQVEVLAEGSAAPMAEFMALLQRGPAAAEVTSFVVTDEAPIVELGVFGPVS